MDQNKRFSFWPWAIILFFVLLASFHAVVLYIFTKNRPVLVEKDHYDKGINYQPVLDETVNFQKLNIQKVLLNTSLPGKIQVSFQFLPDDIKLTSVKILLRSLVSQQQDQEIALLEESSGDWIGDVEQVLGQYEVIINLADEKGQNYRYRQLHFFR